MMKSVEIIYEDAELLVVEKPAGIASQSDRGTAPDLVNLLKNELFSRDKKVPEIYPVHRLDKPVGGLMVLAKTKGAAAGLSKQIREGEVFSKKYYALAEGEFPDCVGVRTEACDFLAEDKRANLSRVVPEGTPGAKKARLFYTGLWARNGRTLFSVELLTGRRHQIRVQMAARGMALAGDRRYHPETKEKALGLFCYELCFTHPKNGKKMAFSKECPWEFD